MPCFFFFHMHPQYILGFCIAIFLSEEHPEKNTRNTHIQTPQGFQRNWAWPITLPLHYYVLLRLIMHVSWHLNYLRLTLYTHRYTPSISQHAYTLSLWREHFNSAHNAGWGTLSNNGCLSLNARCGTFCSLGCHAHIVALSHWLSARSDVHRRRQNLSPAGLTDWIKFGAVNHRSGTPCMNVISVQICNLEAEICSRVLYTDDVHSMATSPNVHISVRKPRGHPS